jgi:hypothetical protein
MSTSAGFQMKIGNGGGYRRAAMAIHAPLAAITR